MMVDNKFKISYEQIMDNYTKRMQTFFHQGFEDIFQELFADSLDQP